MKRSTIILIAFAALSLGIALLAGTSSTADATTTWSYSATGTYQQSVATTTTANEAGAAPSAATDGIYVPAGKTMVIVVKAHIIVNSNNDAGEPDDSGYYDPNGGGFGTDGSCDAGPNTFGSGTFLHAWFYDVMTSTWTRYPVADLTPDVGASSFTRTQTFALAGRYAYTIGHSNVPAKVYLTLR